MHHLHPLSQSFSTLFQPKTNEPPNKRKTTAVVYIDERRVGSYFHCQPRRLTRQLLTEFEKEAEEQGERERLRSHPGLLGKLGHNYLCVCVYLWGGLLL